MNYLTIEFIIFALVTLIVFYVWPKKYIKYRYIVLLLASYVFISFHNWRYGLIVLGNTLVSYLCGLFTHRSKKRVAHSDNQSTTATEELSIENQEVNKHQGRRTWVMVLSIVLNIGLLVTVKYFNWIGGSVAALINKPFTAIDFIVPLGISFYIFTLVAYNIDVWRKKITAESNFLKFATFVSFFPKLIQGPIMSYGELARGTEEGSLFSETTFKDIDFLKPFQRFIFGLLKKVLIADIIGVYVTYIWGNIYSVPGIYFPIVAILYAVQLYCDFSGYMDMTLGIAGLFGIKLSENFNTPYLSKTVQEFWNRWHMSLGRWLRDYIYIPLGGSRVSKPHWAFNILVVWLVSGIWHGASWTFVLWGLYYAVLLILGGLFRKWSVRKFGQYNGKFANGLRVFRTFTLVTIGWSLFSAPDIMTYLRFGKRFLLHVFDGSLLTIFNESTLPRPYLLMTFIILIAVLLFYYFNSIKKSFDKLFSNIIVKNTLGFVFNAGTLVASIYMLLVMSGLGAGASGFIYFNF